MTIDASFIAEVSEKIKAIEPGWTRNFRFNITSVDGKGEGFNIPPLRKISQVIDAAADGPLSPDAKEDLLRMMLSGKRVEVRWVESEKGIDQKLGEFVYNDIPPGPPGNPGMQGFNSAPTFDGFDVLRDNPAAYRTLCNLALSTVLLKSMPPRIAAPSPAAKRTVQRPLPPRQSLGA